MQSQAPVSSSQPSILHALARFVWVGLLPAGLALAAASSLGTDLRHLRAPAAGFIESLAGARLAVGILLFVVFSAIARHWLPLVATRFGVPAAQMAPAAGRPLRTVLMIVGAAATALVLRQSLAAPFRVESGSMLPTLLPFDQAIVNNLAYGVRLPGTDHVAAATLPRRGDVVVFARRDEHGRRQSVVKRVIGLPGDTITMQSGHPVVDGNLLPSCDAGTYVHPGPEGGTLGRLEVEFLDERAYLTVHAMPPTTFDGTFVVPAGELFVLGDNRNQSIDSRHYGAGGAGIPLADVRGQVVRLFGAERDGGLDSSRFSVKIDAALALPGIDAAALRAKVEACRRGHLAAAKRLPGRHQ